MTVEQDKSRGRRIYAGDNFWTVMSLSRIPLKHPFEPPLAFSDRVPRLRRNKRIRATKLRVAERVERQTQAITAGDEPGDNASNSDAQEVSIHQIPYRSVGK